MPDYTDGIGGPDLTALDVNYPADSESVANLPAAIRQVKAILKNNISASHEPETGLQLTESAGASTIPTGGVSGSNDNSPTATEGKIKQGTVSTPDLKDAAVTAAKLATDAVTKEKIADFAIDASRLEANAVEEDKILNGAVTTDKIDDGAVTAAKMAANSVATAAIVDLNVTTGKIADLAVTPAKLSMPMAEGRILIAQSGADAQFKTVSGAMTITKDGVVTLAGSVAAGFARFRERAAAGTNGGAATALVDLPANALTGVRGTAALVPWEKSGNNAADWEIEADGEIKYLPTVGKKAVIMAESPAFGVGKHKCALQVLDAAGALVATYYGTSETAPAGVQTRSTLNAVIDVQQNYRIRLRHYVQTPAAAADFGSPTSGTGNPEEVYATLMVL